MGGDCSQNESGRARGAANGQGGGSGAVSHGSYSHNEPLAWLQCFTRIIIVTGYQYNVVSIAVVKDSK